MLSEQEFRLEADRPLEQLQRSLMPLADSEGFTGHQGSDCVHMYAAQKIAPHSSIWHQPSAMRGRSRLRASADPMLLPMPMPNRNTARISEKV